MYYSCNWGHGKDELDSTAESAWLTTDYCSHGELRSKRISCSSRQRQVLMAVKGATVHPETYKTSQDLGSDPAYCHFQHMS